MFILPLFFKNARWDVVQSEQFCFSHIAEFVIYHKVCVDFSFGLCYAEYVGAVIGIASLFTYLQGVSPGFVNFHMERF